MKRKKSEGTRALDKSERRRSFRMGGYTTLVSVLALAVVIGLNLLLGLVPVNLTKFDTSTAKIFTLGENSRTLLADLDEDVTLYLLAQLGTENQTLAALLERYAAQSPHIHVVQKDPVLYPSFVSGFTGEQYYMNSVLVVNESQSRYRLVSYYDLYSSATSSYTGATKNSFNGENQLTSAIDFVTNVNLPIVYALAGHNELEMNATLRAAVDTNNTRIESLTLSSVDAVPEDAAAVMILAPVSDLSEEEVQKLLAYRARGGQFLVVTDYMETALPNLLRVLEDFGVTAVPGIVMEADESYAISGYPHYLIPDVNAHEISRSISGKQVVMPLAQGIQGIETLPETISLTGILTTSQSAYAKVDGYNMTTLEQEAKDITGPFAVGVSSEDSLTGSRLAWFTTSGLVDASIDEITQGNNTQLFLGALNWLAPHENSLDIAARDITTGYLLFTAAEAKLWMILFALAAPLLTLTIGVWVWWRRKSR